MAEQSTATSIQPIDAVTAQAEQALVRGAATEALALIEQAQHLAAQSAESTPTQKANLTRLTGQAMRELGHYADAIRYLLDALEQFRAIEDIDNALKCLVSIGSAFSYIGDNEQSIAFQLEALALAEQIGDTGGICRAHIGIGYAYQESEQYKEAARYYHSALTLAQQIGHRLYEGGILNNFAVLSNAQSNYRDALKYGSRALMIQEMAGSGHCYTRNAMATACIELEMYPRAQQYLLENMRVQQTLDEHRPLTKTLKLLGELFVAQKRFDDALPWLERGYQLAERAGALPLVSEFLTLLSQTYSGKEQWREAWHISQWQSDVQTQLLEQRADQRLHALELQYQARLHQEKAQEALVRQTELESVVAERTSELQALTDQLQDALAQEAELNKLRSRIISTLAHEFRTPLTVINSSADMLIKHYNRMKPQKREQIQGRMSDSIYYLSDMLQDISLVDAVHAVGIEPKPTEIPFNEMCAELERSLLRQGGSAHRLDISYDDNDQRILQVDRRLIDRILLNIVSNACKFSPADSTVYVSMELNEHIRFEVLDTGIGVPNDAKQRIWDLFFRADNLDHQRGQGLGLYIVKQLTDALDGSVTVLDNADGVGSTFLVSLPFLPAA